MGSQRRLIEDLTERGIIDPPIELVHAIEDMKRIGDDMGSAINIWLMGDEKLHELNDRCEWIIGRVNAGYAMIDYYARQANVR